jgi:hypothetical protein
MRFRGVRSAEGVIASYGAVMLGETRSLKVRDVCSKADEDFGDDVALNFGGSAEYRVGTAIEIFRHNR